MPIRSKIQFLKRDHLVLVVALSLQELVVEVKTASSLKWKVLSKNRVPINPLIRKLRLETNISGKKTL